MKIRVKSLIAIAIVMATAPFFVNMSMVEPEGIQYADLEDLSPEGGAGSAIGKGATVGTVSSGGKCKKRPTAGGLPYYNAMTSSGLRDVEILSHSGTRLGYGLSSLGPLVPAKANDCTTVFFAEEIRRQIATIGEGNDNGQLNGIRGGLLPLSMYTRGEIAGAIRRFTDNDDARKAGAADDVTNKAWVETSQLLTLRNMLGSQTIVNGEVIDHQVNLQEIFGEMWINHFNINFAKFGQYHGGRNGFSDVIRRQYGTTFLALLTAAMSHPSMIIYLDNDKNRATCQTGTGGKTCFPSNLNLGRELLELHTIGMATSTPGTPYTEADVQAMANILAGWNVIPWTAKTNPADFVFNSTLSADVPVTLMGVSYPATYETAQNRVHTVFRRLANMPETRNNICGLLVSHLFADPAAIVKAKATCASAWGTDGQLQAIYAALLSMNEFWAPANYRTMYRTPIEIPIATARGLGINIKNLRQAVSKYDLVAEDLDPSKITWKQLPVQLKKIFESAPNWTLGSIHGSINDLLGAFRGNISFPTGYDIVGANHISPSFVDTASRLALNAAIVLDGMTWNSREDVLRPGVRTAVAERSEKNAEAGARYFFSSAARMGTVDSFGAANNATSPYKFTASQESIIAKMPGKKANWPLDSDGVPQLAHAMACVGLSTAQMMKK